MLRTAIVEVRAWEAFDSRGRPTVGCVVRVDGGGSGRAIVPSGASRGSHEVCELRDGGARYGGDGVRTAVWNVTGVLAAAVCGLDAADQAAVDAALQAADGTAALERLGGNAVLAVSLAAMLAVADETRTPLYRLLAGDAAPLLPLPMVNVVSGGAHAAGFLDIQDVLVVPVGASSFAEAMEWSWRVRAAAAALLEEQGGRSALVADEGGLAAPLGSNEAGVRLVAEGIERSGLAAGRDAAIAVDVAANQITARDGRIQLRAEHRVLSTPEWIDEVAAWCDRYPIVSIEDVLAEDDWTGWAEATERLGAGRQLLGDDLFVTNVDRLRRGVADGAANAVLIKPNQAGTFTSARGVVAAARDAGYVPVISARSGDTEQAWLADLAVGWRTGQIKVGSLTRSERTVKWNRLLQIEADHGAAAEFAGREALADNTRRRR
ncbi:MAG: phosphopyruvate hydratase [Micromonosporaceae bacterium]|nr:phosphopyruvate hydratase [Micromonosporaceae bacterium]